MDGAGKQLLTGSARTEQHHRHVGAGDALDGLGDLQHLRRGGNDRAEHRRRAPALEAAVLLLDLIEMERPRDDQAEVVDVDRLLVEVIGTHSDRLERAFAGAMAAGDDDLRVGFQPQDFLKHRETFVGAVGIRRKSEVERNHRRLVRPQRFYGGLPVTGANHLIAFVGPLELALQSLVVFDDQQDFEIFGVGHARFRCGSLSRSAAGSVMVKVVPWPGRLSTPRRPPIAVISERASNAPIPKPPALVEANGWNSRLRMKSPSIPTPLSVMTMVTFRSSPSTRTVTGVALLASSAFWRR